MLNDINVTVNVMRHNDATNSEVEGDFRDCHRIDWFSCNILDLYSSVAWFESRPRHRLTWVRPLVISLIPSRQIPGQCLG